MQASLRSLSAFRTGMKSSVSWAYQCRKNWLRKIQRALPVLHHSFPQIWFAQTDGELPCRAGEFAKGSQTYAGTGTLRYTWWGRAHFTPPKSTTCPVGDGQISSILAGRGSSLREKRPEEPMRAKSIFARTFKLIGPSSPFCKNSFISYFPKLCLRLCIPHRQEGRTRRHERGAGMRWT